ncbi:MAG: glycosyltransferase [Myxococcota bacterium]|nr:glycosyltransferase [Myxococcota bacterium]
MPPRPRISLFLTSLAASGVARATLRLAGGLRRSGVDVDVVVTLGGGEHAAEIPRDVALHTLPWGARWPTPLIRHGLLRDPKAPWHRFHYARALPALLSYLERRRPDAVLCAASYANYLGVLGRRASPHAFRLVLSQRTHLSAKVERRSKHWKLRMARRLYADADAFVAVSEGVAGDLGDVVGIESGRIQTIYNPIDGAHLALQARAPIDHPWLRRGAPPVVLAVGKLKARKGFDVLLRAFSRLRAERPARLLILGEGPERGELEALAAELGIAADVGLPGFVENPMPFMARASAFALPSEREGLPNVLIEALACGATIVATDCPSGPAEILEGGRHGRLVPTNDPAALGRALAASLDAPADPERQRARAAHFSLASAVARYRAVLLPEPEAGSQPFSSQSAQSGSSTRRLASS